jgi:DNA-binding transcriptional regulator PaaX
MTTLDGAERAIYAVVSQYSREQPIGRGELVRKVARLGYELPERVVREAIKQMRRNGYLICATAGTNGGYYVARDLAEVEEFGRLEYIAKIADMSETWTATEQFGAAYQVGLFGGMR